MKRPCCTMSGEQEECFGQHSDEALPALLLAQYGYHTGNREIYLRQAQLATKLLKHNVRCAGSSICHEVF